VTLNKSSRLGLYAVVLMAGRRDELVSAALVAQTFDVSEDHVAKVLQQLMRARIVAGVRGAGGGYRLAVDPRQLTMLAVVEAVEGPLRPDCYGCDAGAGACRHPASCAIRGVLEEIGHYAVITLQSVTIATLAAGPPARRSLAST
jgi:Rrf2 family nitric oxide-sensitive transcriptional repressor